MRCCFDGGLASVVLQGALLADLPHSRQSPFGVSFGTDLLDAPKSQYWSIANDRPHFSLTPLLAFHLPYLINKNTNRLPLLRTRIFAPPVYQPTFSHMSRRFARQVPLRLGCRPRRCRVALYCNSFRCSFKGQMFDLGQHEFYCLGPFRVKVTPLRLALFLCQQREPDDYAIRVVFRFVNRHRVTFRPVDCFYSFLFFIIHIPPLRPVPLQSGHGLTKLPCFL